MNRRHIAIISPAQSNANNGNWQTARRWAQFLAEAYEVSLLPAWDHRPYDAMIALHARRSAASIAAYRKAYPSHPIVLALTGTDLYRDIHSDPEAQASLRIADRLVILQAAGLQELPENLRAKTNVIYQSADILEPVAKPDPSNFTVIMIGHLRPEKDPATFMQAARRVQNDRVRMVHVGGDLDPALGRLARETEGAVSRYRWLGNLPHETTRQYLRESDLMVISSIMEGGANVIIEAITSGVPVLASAISGNRGMLGDDYAGYFPTGDSTALAQEIDRLAGDHAACARLQAQCRARMDLFRPEREAAAVRQMMDNLTIFHHFHHSATGKPSVAGL